MFTLNILSVIEQDMESWFWLDVLYCLGMKNFSFH